MNVIISIRYIILLYLLQSYVCIEQLFILLNQQLIINHPIYYEVDTNHWNHGLWVKCIWFELQLVSHHWWELDMQLNWHNSQHPQSQSHVFELVYKAYDFRTGQDDYLTTGNLSFTMLLLKMLFSYWVLEFRK